MLRVQALTKHYGRGWGPWSEPPIVAVDTVSFAIARGESVGLIGETGSGKSTIARCILRLSQPTSGQIQFEGVDIFRLSGASLQRFRRSVQMVFQDPNASLDPRQTVSEVLAEPLRLHGRLRGTELRMEVIRLLEEVELSASVLERRPHQLSGGQQQRVAIGRAIALRPQLVVLDEPTSALDASVRGQILNLLRRLHSDYQMGFLYISHDIRTVAYLCRRALVMLRGQLVEVGSMPELLASPTHPYTKALTEAAGLGGLSVGMREDAERFVENQAN
jgi:ABC-type glutathione transport system ATPase component